MTTTPVDSAVPVTIEQRPRLLYQQRDTQIQ